MSKHVILLLVLAVLIVACLGKVLGVTFGLVISKMPLRQSAAIGFAMNARGAMEMILGYDCQGCWTY